MLRYVTCLSFLTLALQFMPCLQLCQELAVPCVFAAEGCVYTGNAQQQRLHRPHCHLNKVHCHLCNAFIRRDKVRGRTPCTLHTSQSCFASYPYPLVARGSLAGPQPPGNCSRTGPIACLPLGQERLLVQEQPRRGRAPSHGVWCGMKTDTPLVTLFVSCSICPFWTIKCPCCGDDVGKAQWPDHAARSCANRGRRIALVSMLPLAHALLATGASEI